MIFSAGCEYPDWSSSGRQLTFCQRPSLTLICDQFWHLMFLVFSLFFVVLLMSSFLQFCSLRYQKPAVQEMYSKPVYSVYALVNVK